MFRHQIVRDAVPATARVATDKGPIVRARQTQQQHHSSRFTATGQHDAVTAQLAEECRGTTNIS